MNRKGLAFLVVASLVLGLVPVFVLPAFAVPVATFIGGIGQGVVSNANICNGIAAANVFCAGGGFIAIVIVEFDNCGANPSGQALSDTWGSSWNTVRSSATRTDVTQSGGGECAGVGDSTFRHNVVMFSAVLQNPTGQDVFTATGSGTTAANRIRVLFFSGVSTLNDGTSTAGETGTSSSMTVTSWTPGATSSIVIAGYSSCGAQTYSVGTGFTFDLSQTGTACAATTIGVGPGLGTEYRTSNAGAQTCPMTLSLAGSWAGVCASFPLGVSTPFICEVANGGSSATITLSGTKVDPTTMTCPAKSTGTTNIPFWFTATNGVTVTATEQADATNTRYRFPSPTVESSTTTETSCATGPICSTWNVIDYLQDKHTCQATPLTPATWEANHQIQFYAEKVGLTAKVVQVSPLNGGGAVSGTCWADYNTGIIADDSDTVSTIFWQPTARVSANLTSSGDTVNFNFNKAFTSQTTTTSTSMTTTTTTTTTTSSSSTPSAFPWWVLIPVFIAISLLVLAGRRRR